MSILCMLIEKISEHIFKEVAVDPPNGPLSQKPNGPAIACRLRNRNPNPYLKPNPNPNLNPNPNSNHNPNTNATV